MLRGTPPRRAHFSSIFIPLYPTPLTLISLSDTVVMFYGSLVDLASPARGGSGDRPDDPHTRLSCGRLAPRGDTAEHAGREQRPVLDSQRDRTGARPSLAGRTRVRRPISKTDKIFGTAGETALPSKAQPCLGFSGHPYVARATVAGQTTARPGRVAVAGQVQTGLSGGTAGSQGRTGGYRCVPTGFYGGHAAAPTGLTRS